MITLQMQRSNHDPLVTDGNEEYTRYTYDGSMVTQRQTGRNYFNSLLKENTASLVATFPPMKFRKK